MTHRPEGQWAFSDSYMEAEAARLGLGLAYVPVELMGDDPERGTLIRVLQRYKPADGRTVPLLSTPQRIPGAESGD